MKKLITLLGLAAFAFAGQAVAAEKGFKSIFDGKSLKGWNGDPKFWSVQDGAITGKTTKENPTKGNTFIIWDGGKPATSICVSTTRSLVATVAFSIAVSN